MRVKTMVATLLAGSALNISAAMAGALPTTPAGITLIEVVRELPVSQPEILWIAIGSAEGGTLMFRDADGPDSSGCTGSCAEEFRPAQVHAGATASGEWSIVRRPDGTNQWAYQGRPLYSWSKEQVPAEVATNVGLTETATAKFAEDEVVAGSLMPPEGWQVARFTPADSMVLPDGVNARLVNSAQAVVLTSADGFTLYSFSGDVREDRQACAGSACDNRWQPLFAAALAGDVGDFSVVTRADGTRQWAYQSRALYTYAGDRLPGDAHGTDVDPRWSPAALTTNFHPEDVSIASFDGYGDALTLKGMTLYGGYAFEKRWGGRNLRDTFTNVYYKGKKLGPAACTDQVCLDKWRPFLAPADAQPSGFWETVRRSDGSLQWAYKGYALYTHAGDSAAGDYYGQASYDFATAGEARFDFTRVSQLQQVSRAAVAGIYWNIAKP